MKTFTPRNGVWIEDHFNYRVDIVQEVTHDSNHDWVLFTKIKYEMIKHPELWGEYRDDWIGHVDVKPLIRILKPDAPTTKHNSYSDYDQLLDIQYNGFYFMDSSRAELFKQKYVDPLSNMWTPSLRTFLNSLVAAPLGLACRKSAHHNTIILLDGGFSIVAGQNSKNG